MKSVRSIGLVVTVLVIGFIAWNWFHWNRLADGYEVAPREQAPYLKRKLAEDLGFDGFQDAWLKGAWVNGFREHTYLFFVEPDSSNLKAAIASADGIESVGSSYYQDAGYLGPSTAPDWWDSSVIDSADALFFRVNDSKWRFTWIDDRLYIVHST